MQQRSPIMFNPVYDLLRTTQVKAIIPERKLITVKKTDTLPEVLAVLSSNAIMGAPIMDGDTYMGFISVLDLLRYFFHISSQSGAREGTPEESIPSRVRLDPTLVQNKTIDDVLGMPYTNWGLGGLNQWAYVMSTDVLTKPARMFQRGYHRLVVRGDQGEIVNVLTQSDVVRFLGKHIRAKDPKLTILDELTLTTDLWCDVTSVKASDSIADAFRVMWASGVSCLAVQDDETGRLIGNLSPSDLRGAFDEQGAFQWPNFDVTVQEYLSNISPESLKPIVISSHCSLAEAILEFTVSKKHHLWAVDKLLVPCMCLSLTDVLQAARLIRVYREPAVDQLILSTAQQLEDVLGLLRTPEEELLQRLMVPAVTARVSAPLGLQSGKVAESRAGVTSIPVTGRTTRTRAPSTRVPGKIHRIRIQ